MGSYQRFIALMPLREASAVGCEFRFVSFIILLLYKNSFVTKTYNFCHNLIITLVYGMLEWRYPFQELVCLPSSYQWLSN